jgi:hypothetical protein
MQGDLDFYAAPLGLGPIEDDACYKHAAPLALQDGAKSVFENAPGEGTGPTRREVFA